MNPNLVELDRLSQDRYDRPFVELDADQRLELEDEVRDAPDEEPRDYTPYEETASYRESMTDAGRGHLLR